MGSYSKRPCQKPVPHSDDLSSRQIALLQSTKTACSVPIGRRIIVIRQFKTAVFGLRHLEPTLAPTRAPLRNLVPRLKIELNRIVADPCCQLEPHDPHPSYAHDEEQGARKLQKEYD